MTLANANHMALALGAGARQPGELQHALAGYRYPSERSERGTGTGTGYRWRDSYSDRVAGNQEIVTSARCARLRSLPHERAWGRRMASSLIQNEPSRLSSG